MIFMCLLCIKVLFFALNKTPGFLLCFLYVSDAYIKISVNLKKAFLNILPSNEFFGNEPIKLCRAFTILHYRGIINWYASNLRIIDPENA